MPSFMRLDYLPEKVCIKSTAAAHRAWRGGARVDVPMRGVDWSQALCERAAAEMPACRFYALDMSDSGLPEGSYGGLMALGSIEHALDGPQKALAEFYRLLRRLRVGALASGSARPTAVCITRSLRSTLWSHTSDQPRHRP